MNAPLKLGQSITRREDQRFLTGRGRYADNTAPAEAAAVLQRRNALADFHHARRIDLRENNSRLDSAFGENFARYLETIAPTIAFL